jgi:hypothetical protein
MSTSKDLIIGAFTNYDWSKIKYWANSIDKSGFTGDKAVVVYNCDNKTIQELLNRNFRVWGFTKDDQGNLSYPGQLIIVVQRFLHLWQYLDGLSNIDEYRYVISTDVKDVVFQRNPSEWLEKYLDGKKICASSESICYENEPWGADNMQGSYPGFYNRMKSQPIWNCGVQAGEIKTMKDLWLQIWLTCHAAQRPNPDQAAYNLLLSLEPWKSMTRFTYSEEGWACQAGTTVDPTKINSFRPFLLEKEPLWTGQSTTTSTGYAHHILHQWDRIPHWHRAIEIQYG